MKLVLKDIKAPGLYHFGCWFLNKDGVASGFWATLSADPALYDVFFERILVHAQKIGAVVCYCEPSGDMRDQADLVRFK